MRGGFLCAGHHAECFRSFSSSSFQEGGDIITVPSNRWELRHREVKSLTPGHTARTCQSWDLNLGHLPLETNPNL